MGIRIARTAAQELLRLRNAIFIILLSGEKTRTEIAQVFLREGFTSQQITNAINDLITNGRRGFTIEES